MKLTLGWLKDHLETDADVGKVAEKLTSLGLEVETIHDPAAALAPFVIAQVISAEKHPNADRLRVCVVDTGKIKTQVVCGAPNARAGMKGAFAPVGTYIPGTKITLEKGIIRGVESNGMLCSERELGLSEEHEGIIDLPPEAPVGMLVADFMGINDPVIEIAITPDRADCLSVRGIARDLAAAGLGRLKPMKIESMKGSYDPPLKWVRDLASHEDACPYVAGRHFRGIKNGPSPGWMQQRLRAIGLRPISVLVDITNYVTFDLGRPLHVFDAAKLSGDTLRMRLAKNKESVAALDGKTYTLDDAMTVIADGKGPQAIGGIMGGAATGCSEETTEVFLEVALFDSARTAKTGRKLQVNSDARYRFERGLDPISAAWGEDVAVRMILDLCGGDVSYSTHAGKIPDDKSEIVLRYAKIAALTGMEISPSEAKGILQRLGFEVIKEEGTASLRVRVPSWRTRDVEGEADLIEEVARVHGYQFIPATPLPPLSVLPYPAIDSIQRRQGLAKRALAARGLMEAVTFSFLSADHAALFGGTNPALQLINPIAADLDTMRPSLLPNLLAAGLRNLARGQDQQGLFEVGPVYSDDTPEGQHTQAASIRLGQSHARHWAHQPTKVDAFDAKADALAVLAACGAPLDKLSTFAEAPSWYHPGRSGELRLGPKQTLARFGEIHPRIAAAFDIKTSVVAVEVLLAAIPFAKRKTRRIPPLQASAFQAVERDFAFLVASEVSAEALLRSVRGADKTLITAATVFDVYEGDKVEKGKKSIAVTVTLQAADHTLAEAEIESVSQKIVAQVTKQTGAVLRG